ncbi:MAG: flavodoxin family protein [Sphaerochaetaceae bacterium]|nr:flavodoxin family protein [Sphaerochaetaceae bacterium]
MTTAIVYYSRNGSSRMVAELISEQTGGLITELVPVHPFTSFLYAGFSSVAQRRVKLTGIPHEAIKTASRLILISPVWAGRKNPVMNSFLADAVLTGKSVDLITVQADPHRSSLERVLPAFRDMVSERGGTVRSLTALHGASVGKTALREDLAGQLASFQ